MVTSVQIEAPSVGKGNVRRVTVSAAPSVRGYLIAPTVNPAMKRSTKKL